MAFSQLHLHSVASVQDSIIDPDALASKLVELGQKATAVTDHGNIAWVFQIRKALEKKGINHFPGSEFYFCPDRFARGKENNKSDHLVVVAINDIGAKNLFKLSSLSYLEGFYFRPRIDPAILLKHGEGLVVTSACLKSPISRKILTGDMKGAAALAEAFRDGLGDRFLLEIMPHDLTDQTFVNKGLYQLHKDLGIPMVATIDSHYLEHADKKYQDVFFAAMVKQRLDSPDRPKMTSPTHHVMGEDEVIKSFMQYHSYFEKKDIVAAVEKAGGVLSGPAPRISDGKLHFPAFGLSIDVATQDGLQDVAKAFIDKQDRIGYFRALARKGLRDKQLKGDRYSARLESELDSITKFDFVDYFLVVRDIVMWSLRNGISVGPGRGTVGSSLVAYCIGITKVDPMKYDLIFERFINPERKGLPDIDLDFDYMHRERVIQYIFDKYGRENVAQVGTMTRMNTKAAIKDLGRTMGMSQDELDILSKAVPWEEYNNVDETVENHPDAGELVRDNKELFDYVRKLEGHPKNFGKHPSGVVISSDKIIEHAPLMIGSKEEDEETKSVVTQLDLEAIKSAGLVKMDILGLKTLTFIQEVLKQIKETSGEVIDLDGLDMEDPKVYKMIAEGETSFCFQIETPGLTKALMAVQPTKFHHLYDMLSIYRPGALETGQFTRYLENKKKFEEDPTIKFHPVPMVNEIIQQTYGCWAYQEQVMKAYGVVAGLGMATADTVRRIIDDLKMKGKEEIIAGYKDKFLSGCQKNSMTEQEAHDLWDELSRYTGYSFNRSHSVEYGVLSYQTAWLKCYYPHQFLVAMFNTSEKNEKETKGSIKSCIKFARKMKFGITKPHVNESGFGFKLKGESVLWGLEHIKNFGEKAAEEVAAKAPYTSLRDMLTKVEKRKVNKRCVVALIGAGAFDSFDQAEVRETFKKEYKEDLDSQLQDDTLWKEITFLGVPVTCNYKSRFSDYLQDVLKLSSTAAMRRGEYGTFAGMIVDSFTKKSKKGRHYAQIHVEDDNFEPALIYTNMKAFEMLGEHVKPGNFVKFNAEVLETGKMRLVKDELVSLTIKQARTAARA